MAGRSTTGARGDVRGFSLPPGWRADVFCAAPSRPIRDFARAALRELRSPLASPPLAGLARPGMKVCVLFTDATRPCPDDAMVPLVADELLRAGVARKDIVLVCARGMHRPSSREERAAKLGRAFSMGIGVTDSGGARMTGYARPGRTAAGIPVAIDRAAAGADLVVATGVVEPHQYAGFSGGFKTLAIGAAGDETISATHALSFVEHPACAPASLDGNPFQEALREIAGRARLGFALNVVLGASGRPVAVRGGDPGAVFRALAAVAGRLFVRETAREYDLAILFVAPSKGRSLYQASRAVTSLRLSPRSPLRAGAPAILVAPLEEGHGKGRGEARFARLVESRTSEEIVAELRGRSPLAGEQRAWMLARAMREGNVLVAGGAHLRSGDPGRLSFHGTVGEALVACAGALGGGGRALVVRDATRLVLRRRAAGGGIAP